MKGTKEDAVSIVTVLHDKGYEAYLAGGCVRDMLLGLPPSDYDVATQATPEQVQATFENTIPVGISFGVVKVVIDHRETDVATFRVDGQYSDNRRPDTVTLTSSAKEDVQRRDFTINGMLMDHAGKIFDYVGGEKDLQDKIIRTIGNPEERFSEDPLRMMRAIRFAVKYNFTIEKDTWATIRRLADTIKIVSAERVTEEISKMFTCGNSEKAFLLLRRSGLWTNWFSLTTSGDNAWASLEPLSKMTKDDPFILALAFILCRTYAHNMETHLSKLRLTNEQSAALATLLHHVTEHANFMVKDLATQRKQMQWDDLPLVEKFLAYQGIEPQAKYNYHGGMGPQAIETHKKFVRNMGWPAALINGKWLIEHNYVPGASFTPMLEAVRTEQLNGHLVFEQDVTSFLEEHFPCATRKIDGRIVDPTSPTRICAQCPKCNAVMSAEVPRDAKGNWLWSTAVNAISIREKTRSFVVCICRGKKAKRAFKEIIV